MAVISVKSEGGRDVWKRVNGSGTRDDPYTEITGDGADSISLVESEILSTYGDTVSVLTKSKSLVKFGALSDLGTVEQMVWSAGGIETLVTGNEIDSVSSTSIVDTASVVIEGHTIDANGDLAFAIQTATLAGQSRVVLTTPLHRATRISVIGPVELAGDAFVYQETPLVNGAPINRNLIHLEALAGDNQSLKAATSTSSSDYWIINGLTLGVNRAASRSVAFKLQVRESGGVFKTKRFASCSSDQGSVYLPQDPPLIVPKNSDVRVLATSTGNSTGVETTIHGRLAIITGTA